jgi:hypothetical protein
LASLLYFQRIRQYIGQERTHSEGHVPKSTGAQEVHRNGGGVFPGQRHTFGRRLTKQTDTFGSIKCQHDTHCHSGDSLMATVLITGGRAPATLDLARHFSTAGHRVIGVEHWRCHLSRPSNAFSCWYTIPAPLTDRLAFESELLDIVRRELVDLLIPTCEEVFHIARAYAKLSEHCTVFCASLDVLRGLHSKFTFNQSARDLGLPAPDTWLVTDRDQLLDFLHVAGPDLVFKPEYSRFATHVVIGPRTGRDVDQIAPTPENAWVVQERLTGRHICTFSTAHAGRVTAHTTYASEITAGSAAVHFEHIDHAEAVEWVKRFVEGKALSGQLSFDFIEVPGRDLLPLECNPRITSGLHLFEDSARITNAYLDPAAPHVTPHIGSSAMVTAAVLLYGLPSIRSMGDLARIARAIWSARDVVCSIRDPLPGALQLLAIVQLLLQGIRHRRSMTAVSTIDIEYDGGI